MRSPAWQNAVDKDAFIFRKNKTAENGWEIAFKL